MNTSLLREISISSRPGEPTEAPPGSARKILVLMERASRREPLFHPRDNLKRWPEEQADELDELLDEDLEADLAG
ncbi:MAG: hypothetical protein U0840_15145 [Gemmataceae bacterium]